MKNKFDETYNQIVARNFYENIKTLSHNYKVITESKSKSAKDFYDSLIEINEKLKK